MINEINMTEYLKRGDQKEEEITIQEIPTINH